MMEYMKIRNISNLNNEHIVNKSTVINAILPYKNCHTRCILNLKSAILFVILLITLALSLVTPVVSNAEASLYTPRYLRQAEILKSLGLFSGVSSTEFDPYLEGELTRETAMILLCLVFGWDFDKNDTSVFSDVSKWAQPYVKSAYDNGVSYGIGNDLFGGSIKPTNRELITWILRELGYKDIWNKDTAIWDQNITTYSKLAGLIVDTSTKSLAANSLRDDLVGLCYKALFTYPVSLMLQQNNNIDSSNSSLTSQAVLTSDKTILETLLRNNKIPQEQIASLGITTELSSTQILYKLTNGKFSTIPSNDIQIFESLKYALINQTEKLNFDASSYSESFFDAFKYMLPYAISSIEKELGIYDFYGGYSYNGLGKDIKITLKYLMSKEIIQSTLKRADEIISELITDEMTEYQKEKALHDYIINNTVYNIDVLKEDLGLDFTHTPEGVFLRGSAVCDGYSEAMLLLCKKIGIECHIILGSTIDSPSEIPTHAWNIIKIDGEYYHLDITWDDPILKNQEQTLRYDYFNLSDADMSKDHIWNTYSYPECTSNQNNYYVKENYFASDINEYNAIVKNAINNKETHISIKCSEFTPTVDQITASVWQYSGHSGDISYSFNELHNITEIFLLFD